MNTAKGSRITLPELDMGMERKASEEIILQFRIREWRVLERVGEGLLHRRLLIECHQERIQQVGRASLKKTLATAMDMGTVAAQMLSPGTSEMPATGMATGMAMETGMDAVLTHLLRTRIL